LDWVTGRRVETFDRCNDGLFDITDADPTGPHGLAIHMYGAAPAITAATAKFGACQLQIFPQYPQQRCVWFRIYEIAASIDLQLRHFFSPTNSFYAFSF
jgi:hypothetical protein